MIIRVGKVGAVKKSPCVFITPLNSPVNVPNNNVVRCHSVFVNEFFATSITLFGGVRKFAKCVWVWRHPRMPLISRDDWSRWRVAGISNILTAIPPLAIRCRHLTGKVDMATLLIGPRYVKWVVC